MPIPPGPNPEQGHAFHSPGFDGTVPPSPSGLSELEAMASPAELPAYGKADLKSQQYPSNSEIAMPDQVHELDAPDQLKFKLIFKDQG
jgi:hypothetical protein